MLLVCMSHESIQHSPTSKLLFQHFCLLSSTQKARIYRKLGLKATEQTIQTIEYLTKVQNVVGLNPASNIFLFFVASPVVLLAIFSAYHTYLRI